MGEPREEYTGLIHIDCPRCDSNGYVIEYDYDIRGSGNEIQEQCRRCMGSGRIIITWTEYLTRRYRDYEF